MFAAVWRIVQKLDRLIDVIGKFHQAFEKLHVPTARVSFELEARKSASFTW